MPAREIALIWVPSGLEPLTSYKGEEYPREYHDTLLSAVSDALTRYDAQSEDGFQPWLRAGAGIGAHVFNIAGIRLLKDAYDEGYQAARHI